MISKTVKLAVVVFLFAVISQSQELTESDFRVGDLVVNEKVDTTFLFTRFGSPIKIEQFIETHRTPSPETTYVCQFDSVSVTFDRFGIRYLEFTTSSWATHRGVQIGDEPEKILKLYGKPSTERYLDFSEDPNEDVLSYYIRPNSTLGIAFYLHNKRVWKIIVGWGAGC